MPKIKCKANCLYKDYFNNCSYNGEIELKRHAPPDMPEYNELEEYHCFNCSKFRYPDEPEGQPRTIESMRRLHYYGTDSVPELKRMGIINDGREN
jgi:hypothetical protein